MPDHSARLSATNWAALVALCLVLAASVSARIYLHGRTPDTSELSTDGGPADLGEGVFLARVETTSRTVWAGSCDAPVAVDFVSSTLPDGDAPSTSDDRTSYVYRGQVLDGRLAPLELRALHYGRRALGLLHIADRTETDELAVRLTTPMGCDALPEDAMEALRREVR